MCSCTLIADGWAPFEASTDGMVGSLGFLETCEPFRGNVLWFYVTVHFDCVRDRTRERFM